MDNNIWYEIIKEQWSWGAYKSVDDLQIYVNAGWITQAQAEDIATNTKLITEQMEPASTTGAGSASN